jgi:hypothetical protein
MPQFQVKFKKFDGTEQTHTYHELKVICQAFFSMLNTDIQRIGIYEYYGPDEGTRLLVEAVRTTKEEPFILKRIFNSF